MTWIKGANGVSTWDGGQWPDPLLYPEGQKPKRRPGRPRSAKCGTESGYNRHRLDRTPVCDACRTAQREAAERRRAARTRQEVPSHP